MDISVAVSEGYLKPAIDLKVTNDMEEDFNQGLMFGDRNEVLTRGHTAKNLKPVSETRIKKLEERSKLSNYLVLPTKHQFPKTVRIYGYVISFVTNARKGKKLVGELLREGKLWFSTFLCNLLTTKFNSVKILSQADL